VLLGRREGAGTMSDHDAANKMLRESGLSRDTCTELFDLYLEELEDHSESTALEALADMIEEAKEEGGE